MLKIKDFEDYTIDKKAMYLALESINILSIQLINMDIVKLHYKKINIRKCLVCID